MDLFDLDTKKASSEVTKLNLGNGHWIEHLGVDSDEFREARTLMLLKSESGELDAKTEATPFLIASIVKAWSSEKECNIENCMDFFKRNPSLCDAVDRSASAKANFTQMLKGNSSSTRKRTKSSKSPSEKAKSKQRLAKS